VDGDDVGCGEVQVGDTVGGSDTIGPGVGETVRVGVGSWVGAAVVGGGKVVATVGAAVETLGASEGLRDDDVEGSV